MFIIGGALMTIISICFIACGTIAILGLPLYLPYAWYVHSYSEKHTLPKNFSLGKGFFKFYFQLLRFKRPTF